MTTRRRKQEHNAIAQSQVDVKQPETKQEDKNHITIEEKGRGSVRREKEESEQQGLEKYFQLFNHWKLRLKSLKKLSHDEIQF